MPFGWCWASRRHCVTMEGFSDSQCGHLPDLWDLPVPHSSSNSRAYPLYRQRSAEEKEPTLLAAAHGEMHLQVSQSGWPVLVHALLSCVMCL